MAEEPPGTIAADTTGSPIELTGTSNTDARALRRDTWRTGDVSRLSFDMPPNINETDDVNKYESEGTAVGAVVGEAVGVAVGLIVGTAEGDNVGATVGITVGTTVGATVGIAEG